MAALAVVCFSPVSGKKSSSTSAPLQIRFNQPTTLKGALPWYAGKPEGYHGKVPIGYGNAATIDPYWENASLPIGNGNVGASIFGVIDTERISLNEKSLWLGGPNTKGGPSYYWNVNKDAAHNGTLQQIRNAFLQGNPKEAARLCSEGMNGVISYEPKDEEPWRFGTFTSMGELHVQTGLSPQLAEDYRRVLSLDSAMTTVSFRHNGVTYLRESFCSYPDNVLALRFTANLKGMQNLELTYHDNPLATGSLTPVGRDELVYDAMLDNNDMHFVIRIKAIVQGGTLSNDHGRFTVRGANEVVFLLTADTDYKMNFDPDFSDPKAYVGEHPDVNTRQWLNGASALGWSKLLRRHLDDYGQLFNRVKLHISDNQAVDLHKETAQRLADYRNGLSDHYLETLYFQFGRYLLIASSRQGSLPANLQGIWLNNIDGPWHCDYHNNINIQMNYWPALCDNLQECFQPLTDFIKTQVKPGSVTARKYWDARGWTTSISANPFGFTAPLRDPHMSYNLCPIVGPWLSTHLWEYYDFTRDLSWLQNEGYPIIKSSAQFACDYLWRKPDGSLTAAPSTSPEHGEVDEGVTFAHAVVREILLNAIDAATALSTDAAEVAEWKAVLRDLVPYRIGRYGQLMEWSTDIDDPNDHHRHVNHLFGLHPGHTISPVTTPDLAQASRTVLTHRGDGATGWSMGWKLNQWARLHDGNHAYTLYGNLLKNGTADNLWDMHPPFQIDGNFGGTAGVTEMLLQSHMGFLHLLPALPDAWSTGSVSGLRARGNFSVNIHWQGGRLLRASIRSLSGVECSVRYGQQTLTFPTVKGKTYHIRIDKEGHLRQG
ncbi:MAG: glycoside hydrolase family 95 protein [Bacteroidaceae bacterium]|nr:glycoside hydrolase family 95 protein [Bacteroidaceae bacterium]